MMIDPHASAARQLSDMAGTDSDEQHELRRRESQKAAFERIILVLKDPTRWTQFAACGQIANALSSLLGEPAATRLFRFRVLRVYRVVFDERRGKIRPERLRQFLERRLGVRVATHTPGQFLRLLRQFLEAEVTNIPTNSSEAAPVAGQLESANGGDDLDKAMEARLQRLDAAWFSLRQSPTDEKLIEACGLAALEVAKWAVSRSLYVRSLGRGAESNPDARVTEHRVLDVLARHFGKGAASDDAFGPLQTLVGLTRKKAHPFAVAEAAGQSAMALLGTDRLAGVYARHQLVTLVRHAVGWRAIRRLNDRTVGLLQNLDSVQAASDAARCGLPRPEEIEVYAHVSLASYIYGQIAEGELDADAERREARAVADRLMTRLHALGPMSCEPLEEMDAYQVVIADLLDGTQRAATFWGRRSATRIRTMVDFCREHEEFAGLVDLVRRSAERFRPDLAEETEGARLDGPAD